MEDEEQMTEVKRRVMEEEPVLLVYVLRCPSSRNVDRTDVSHR